jgi:hypothetical protein
LEGAGFEEEDGNKRLVCCWFWGSDRKGKELFGFFLFFFIFGLREDQWPWIFCDTIQGRLNLDFIVKFSTIQFYAIEHNFK